LNRKPCEIVLTTDKLVAPGAASGEGKQHVYSYCSALPDGDAPARRPWHTKKFVKDIIPDFNHATFGNHLHAQTLEKAETLKVESRNYFCFLLSRFLIYESLGYYLHSQPATGLFAARAGRAQGADIAEGAMGIAAH
jgi:hypothetical protein